MFIKITASGWAGFSGSMGTCRFNDGIAETTITEARRIGALVRVVECDAEGNEMDPVSHAEEMVRTRALSAEVKTTMETGKEEPAPVPVPAVEEDTTVSPPAKTEVVVKPKPTYTLKQLEEIASKEGIKGLRKITDPLGINATAISKLIEKVMEFQSGAPVAGATIKKD